MFQAGRFLNEEWCIKYIDNVGCVGIDCVTLYRVRMVKLDLQQLLKNRNVELNMDDSGFVYEVDEKTRFKSCEIKNDDCFHHLKFGVRFDDKNNQIVEYGNLTISPTNLYDYNYCPMSLCVFLTYLDYVVKRLANQYGIEVDLSGAGYKKMEMCLNLFPDNKYEEYIRPFKICLHSLPGLKKNMEFGEKQSEPTGDTLAWENSRLKIDTYNKKEELKKAYPEDEDEIEELPETMRLEYILKNEKKVSEVFNTNGIYEITDEMVLEAFRKLFTKYYDNPFSTWSDKNQKILQGVVSDYVKEAHKGKTWLKDWLYSNKNTELDCCYKKNSTDGVLLDKDDLLIELRKKKIPHYSRVVKSISNLLPNDTFDRHDREKIKEISRKAHELID